jgi:hypothetical protein
MIDPQEAPWGMVAVEQKGCCGCCYMDRPRCPKTACIGLERQDNTDVIFVEIKEAENEMP